ncbi:MAG: hypothetical protein RLZZ182_1845 [Pseudomonadota bacterium]
MDVEQFNQVVQGGIFLANTSVAVLMYKMHRDIRSLINGQNRHWYWIEKIRRHIWPRAFEAKDGKEPHSDAA